MTALLIVLYILAGSFVLVAIVGGSGMQLEKISIPPIPHVARIIALAFGIFFFSIALYFTVITILPGLDPAGTPSSPSKESPTQETATKPDEQPNNSKAVVAFTAPPEGGRVDYRQKVSGKVFNISPGRHLWILIYSATTSQYRPMAGPISPNATNGSFELDGYFGNKETTKPDASFSVIATVTSEAETDELVRYRNKDDPKEGLDKMRGTEVGRVTVTRR